VSSTFLLFFYYYRAFLQLLGEIFVVIANEGPVLHFANCKSLGVVRLDRRAVCLARHCCHAEARWLKARVVALQCGGEVQSKKAARTVGNVTVAENVGNKLVIFTSQMFSLF